MPPKKKEDRERQRKEEAERKLREEEERKRLEEIARQEEEVRERIAHEERERLRAEEKARFLEITEILSKEVEIKRVELESWKQEQLNKTQWEHYMSCDKIPHPTNEKALNTYLTLCEEDTSSPLIEDLLNNAAHWLKISQRVEELSHSDGLPTPLPGDAERYEEVLQRVRTLLLKKLDQTTLFYMGEAEKHVDSETYNLLVEASMEHRITFCLWGNVVKNPRLKSFSFTKLDLTLDLPKPLLLADVAIRVMQLDFDPLSPQSHSYRYSSRNRASTGVSTLSGSGGPSEGAAGDLGEVVEEGEEGAGVNLGAEQQAEGAAEDAGDGGEVEIKAGDAAVISTSALEEEQIKDGEETTPPNLDEAERELLEDEIDLRSFRPAGGPIFLQSLELPPNPKVINNWTIRKVLPQNLPVYTYPAEIQRQPSQIAEDATTPPAPVPGSTSWPAIGIKMKLPERYIFPEEPQVAHWDSKENIWCTRGIKDTQFDMDEGTVSFHTYYFSPLAFMVDLYANMPYQSWEMLGRGVDHTLLNLEGGVTQISVEIKGNRSSLVGPLDHPHLAHLLNQPMSARELMNALTKVGANFFPMQDSGKYVKVTKKRTLVEEAAYRGMALASSGYAFMWSQWNSHTSFGKVVVQVAEGGGSEEEADKLTWMNYVGGKRNYKLEVTEESDAFSLEKADGYLTYPGLYSALENAASPSVKEIIRGISPIHTEAVLQWLSATKVLTFA